LTEETEEAPPLEVKVIKEKEVEKNEDLDYEDIDITPEEIEEFEDDNG